MAADHKKEMSKPYKLIQSILLCESAGVVGSLFTLSAIPTWYQTLNKPSFSPPNSLFGPVWITLYLLMGISLYRILQSKQSLDRKEAIRLFLLHLLINASWSIVFFGMQDILGALIVIIALWILIIVLIVKFLKINELAGLLLLPYLAWVSFATLLNYQIWVLNR